MKHRNIIAGILVLAMQNGYAQVTGYIKDKSGEPLINANVIWAGTNTGTITDINGFFNLTRIAKTNLLAVSYIGFDSDTIKVTDTHQPLNIILKEHEMAEVQIVGRRLGIIKSRGLMNEMNISSTELTRAACCNLGESFTTNPSVDVSYPDAATGARQVKLLGLSGSYVQMLTENIPNFRGAAMPYSLGYVPGPWMHSIQVSKGSASVKNGYESITGQINVEFKKPQETEQLNVNLYGDNESRTEANADANIHLNKRLSTGILLHYEDNWGNHDDNNDGFLDKPKVKQYNIQNRWAWMSDKYIFQAGIKALKENREGGQTEHSQAMSAMPTASNELFKINIETKRYEAFAKNAFIFNKEKNSNIALMLSGSLHKQDAVYGYKSYGVNQKNFYASLLFETNFSKKHSFSTGLSLNHDYYDQTYRKENSDKSSYAQDIEKETTPGLYTQYTYNLNEKLIVMAGVRADHSSLYGNFITPRAHIKFAPVGWFSLRTSAGKGFRSVHSLAENNYLMASGRMLTIDKPEQEKAWNYGISTSFYIPLFGKTLNLNAEYYYTDFVKQSIVDYDSNPEEIHITNLQGESYSHTLQVDASYPFFDGLTFTAAYRLNDVKSTYGGFLMEHPLISRYKGLFTASYKTPLGLWQLDATLQLNGGGRMPTPYTKADGTLSWNKRFSPYSQLSAQVTRIFRHWSVYAGGENLTGFTQKNPIIGADNPWGNRFEPTMIWGPTHGAMIYAGIRFNLEKMTKFIE